MNEQEFARSAIKHLNDMKQGLINARLESGDEQQCPRAEVLAIVSDENGTFLGIGANRRPDELGTCDCNDNAPTLAKGSSTCLAIHAEVSAILHASQVDLYKDMYFITTTRPPCRICLSILLNTPIQYIITTDEWGDRDNSKINWEKAGRSWIVVKGE